MTNRDLAGKFFKVATQFDNDSDTKNRFRRISDKIASVEVCLEESFRAGGDLVLLGVPEEAIVIVNLIFRFGFDEARRIYAERSANVLGSFMRYELMMKHSHVHVDPELMLETSRYPRRH